MKNQVSAFVKSFGYSTRYEGKLRIMHLRPVHFVKPKCVVTTLLKKVKEQFGTLNFTIK
jgi:hypothetical protein